MLRPLSASFPRTGLALVLLLGTARTAHAQSGATAPVNECEVDADCGHGFACETVQTGSGGSVGMGGASTGGTSSATGGAGGVGGAMGGVGGAAAGASNTAGVANGGGVAPPTYCGDMICQQPLESPATCSADCGGGYKYCAPATCERPADCAEGYRCAQPVAQGTGGASSVPSFCGDGVCFMPETSVTCPEDCLNLGRCEPDAGSCYSSLDCAPGYYCWLGGGMTGVGGGSASGSGGASSGGAPSGGTGGSSNGGTGTSGTGSGFAPPASTGGTGGAADRPATGGSSGMAAPAPATGGTASMSVGGTAGTAGTAPAGTGGVGGIEEPPVGVCMPGGAGGVGGTAGSIGVGGTSAGAGGMTGGVGGTTIVTGGSAGTGDPCPGGGCGGSVSQSGAGGTSGTDTGGGPTGSGGNNTTGGSESMNGGSKGHDVVTHAGCSVSGGRDGSSLAALALLGAVLGLTRRRARPSVRR